MNESILHSQSNNSTTKKLCHAKWLIHKDAKEYPACMCSGVCFDKYDERGYSYVVFDKRDGKDDQRWLPVVLVRVCTARAVKPVSRFY